jgi:hypothetical protein
MGGWDREEAGASSARSNVKRKIVKSRARCYGRPKSRPTGISGRSASAKPESVHPPNPTENIRQTRCEYPRNPTLAARLWITIKNIRETRHLDLLTENTRLVPSLLQNLAKARPYCLLAVHGKAKNIRETRQNHPRNPNR